MSNTSTVPASPSRQVETASVITSERFLAGMRQFAAGCAVIASQDEGARAGLTATAVCSVTADPPRLLVCVNRKVRAHEMIGASGSLSVNMLSKHQQDVAKRFAGMVEGVTGEDRFSGADWGTGVTGAPMLKDALFSFDCRVVESIPASTHSIFLCEVVDAIVAESGDDPLVYHGGRFATLA